MGSSDRAQRFTGSNYLDVDSLFQFLSSYGLGVMMIWKFGGKGLMNKWMNELMSNKGDCKTAPATPGLLKLVWVGLVDNRPSTN
jgi:hypothetical protein